MSCCCPLPSWAGGSAEEDAPPTERQERVNRYAEELRRERGLSADEEERRLEERLAELEAKHAEALRAGDAGRLADLEGAIADLERALQLDPSRIQIYVGLAFNRNDAGDREGAIRDLERFLKLAPRGASGGAPGPGACPCRAGGS